MIEDFYYKYGLKPEKRLVSKHPVQMPGNTKKYSDYELDRMEQMLKGNDLTEEVADEDAWMENAPLLDDDALPPEGHPIWEEMKKKYSK